MIPTQSQMELPLLRVVASLGGKAKARDVYPLVAKAFPELSADDLERRLAHGERAFNNRVQWTRQSLIDAGQLESGGRGVWAITQSGRDRLRQADGQHSDGESSTRLDFAELHEAYLQRFRRQLLLKISELDSDKFEALGKLLLETYGFDRVEVTRKSRDGGIDGHGQLRVGVATLRAAFQCKKWDGNVGRPEIDRFRGAILGKYEQGIFFTTSDFTKEALGASFQPGAVPIVLHNGSSIVQIMIENELGVTKRPVFDLSDATLGQLLSGDRDGV